MKKMMKPSNLPMSAMLSHKIGEDPVVGEQAASYMKDMREQTKLQRTVYAKMEDKAKENCLLGSSSKLKKEDSRVQKRKALASRNQKLPGEVKTSAEHVKLPKKEPDSSKLAQRPRGLALAKKGSTRETSLNTPQPITPQKR